MNKKEEAMEMLLEAMLETTKDEDVKQEVRLLQKQNQLHNKVLCVVKALTIGENTTHKNKREIIDFVILQISSLIESLHNIAIENNLTLE